MPLFLVASWLYNEADMFLSRYLTGTTPNYVTMEPMERTRHNNKFPDSPAMINNNNGHVTLLLGTNPKILHQQYTTIDARLINASNNENLESVIIYEGVPVSGFDYLGIELYDKNNISEVNPQTKEEVREIKFYDTEMPVQFNHKYKFFMIFPDSSGIGDACMIKVEAKDNLGNVYTSYLERDLKHTNPL